MARRRKFDPDEQLDPDELEELEEEGAFDSRGLLKDGHSTTIKMYMRDGRPNPRLSATQRAIAATHQPLVIDATNNPMAMHKPGFRYLADARQRAMSDAVKAEAIQEVDRRDSNAWRRDYDEFSGSEPRLTGSGAPGRGSGAPAGSYPLSAGEGSSCTIDGAPGVLQRQGNWLVCQPTRRATDAAFDAKAQAYAEDDREQANASRGRG
jgi:hypothetical protein